MAYIQGGDGHGGLFGFLFGGQGNMQNYHHMPQQLYPGQIYPPSPYFGASLHKAIGDTGLLLGQVKSYFERYSDAFRHLKEGFDQEVSWMID